MINPLMALNTRTREKAQIFASKQFKTVHAEAVPDSELSLWIHIFLLHVNMYVCVNSCAAKLPTGPLILSFHHTSVGPIPRVVQCF